MRVGLLVTTYERPDALARVLASVEAQTRPPDCVVVADDGSGPATAAVVAAFAARSRAPVRHAWQPHDGFRAGPARNRGLRELEADYALLVDGDMVLDREFVADHLRVARPGAWVQGCRLPLPPAASDAVLAGADPAGYANDLDLRHRCQAVRRPRLAAALAPVSHRLLAVKACNQGFWIRDLRRVNGYDERLVGWGAEDKELCARLVHAGVRPRGLLYGALAWHLHHPAAARDGLAANLERLGETRRSRRVRATAGLDRHEPNREPPPALPRGARLDGRRHTWATKRAGWFSSGTARAPGTSKTCSPAGRTST